MKKIQKKILKKNKSSDSHKKITKKIKVINNINTDIRRTRRKFLQNIAISSIQLTMYFD